MTGAPACAAGPTVGPLPSAAERCLTRVPGSAELPDYPADLLALKADGALDVTLTFDAPGDAPAVSFEPSPRSRDLQPSVRQYVAAYRVPCLFNGEMAVLKQHYVFKYDNQKVSWLKVSDPASEANSNLARCLKLPTGQPRYPERASESGIQGRLTGLLHFRSADGDPEVEVLGGSNTRLLRAPIKDWLKYARLPCHPGDGKVYSSRVTFIYRMEGNAPTSLRDATLSAFLPQVKGIRQMPVRFDFNKMACPFDVKLGYWQPHFANAVGEVGEPQIERVEFLRWLQTLTLDLPNDLPYDVLGDRMTLSVPCGVLDLTVQ